MKVDRDCIFATAVAQGAMHAITRDTISTINSKSDTPANTLYGIPNTPRLAKMIMMQNCSQHKTRLRASPAEQHRSGCRYSI
jgi:hypothetical protein